MFSLRRSLGLLLGLLLVVLLLVAAVAVTQALRLRAPQHDVPAYTAAIDEAALAERLAAALRIPTLSPTDADPSLDAFLALHAQLASAFPRVHAELERERIGGASLLLRWPGTGDCAPLLLAAHQDVVPVEPGTERQWTHPPFAGVIADGAVWGRGALDDKGSLVAILEAVESLLAEGFRPACDVWLAFGHDEEVGGDGARQMAAELDARGVRPAFVLDEGGIISLGVLAGVDAPLALIGVAEKGYASVRLTAHADGGHSSMPPRRTAIGRLARAVARLEEHRPAARIDPVQRDLLQAIGAHAGFGQRLVLANLWLTAPLVEHMLAASPAGDAALRTTTAPTLFRAGVKDNVLPQQAEAVVNFRLRPGDSIDGVLAHVTRTIDDADIDIALFDGSGSSEPIAPAPWHGAEFAAIERALRRSYRPDGALIVAPFVTVGATDARHYARLTPNLYRFLPVPMTPAQLDGIHGTDEHLPIEDLARMVRFYRALIEDFGVHPAR